MFDEDGYPGDIGDMKAVFFIETTIQLIEKCKRKN